MGPAHHKGPYTRKRKAEERQGNCDSGRIVERPNIAGFADGGRGREPRNATSGLWELEKARKQIVPPPPPPSLYHLDFIFF